MASVQYEVLCRYLHPVSNKPVTNKQKGYDNFAVNRVANDSGVNYRLPPVIEFNSGDLPINPISGQKYTEEEYTSARNYTTDKIFDMLFVFKNVRDVSAKISNGYGSTTVLADTFEQVNGDPWFVTSVSGSLESAMRTAKRLVKKIGINNVKVVKKVPLELNVEIE